MILTILNIMHHKILYQYIEILQCKCTFLPKFTKRASQFHSYTYIKIFGSQYNKILF